MRSDDTARRLGRKDAAGWKAAVATKKQALGVMDTYVNEMENKEAYLEGFCEGACDNPDVVCRLDHDLRR